jgi:hypothetical protein
MPSPSIAKAQHPAPHRQKVSLVTLLFGVFAAPVAWNLQLLIDSALSGHVCYPQDTPLSGIGDTARSWTVGIDVLCLVLALVALVVSIRSWREVRGEKSGGGHHLLDAGEGRTRFMAMLGILNSCLFLLAILSASAGGFVFPFCP